VTKTAVLIFILSSSALYAQKATPPVTEFANAPFAIELTESVAEILKPPTSFPALNPAVFNQLNLIFPYKPGQTWQLRYHSPEIGCALVYGFLGNSAILGNQVGLMPNIAFETNKQARWGFQTKIGMGFSWFNNPYNILSNPENTLIGSRITNITYLGFSYRYTVTDKYNLYAGFSFYHFSNGHYTLPNIGLDAPALTLGVKRYLGQKSSRENDNHDSTAVKNDNKLHVNIFAGWGRHQFGSASSSDGPRYSVYQCALFLSKRYRQIHNWQAGITFTYYSDYYDYIINQELFTSGQRLQATTIRPFIGHEFIMSHIGLLTQLGANVYSPFNTKINVYGSRGLSTALGPYISFKLGVQYYLNNPLFTNKNRMLVGIYLEARPTGADFPQLGLAWSF